jgi:hypothetical protein
MGDTLRTRNLQALSTQFYFNVNVPENNTKKQFFIIIIIIICLSMSLTGLSLEMYIFHFEAISLSTHISGSKRPIFTNLDSLEIHWSINGSQRMSDPKMEL